MKKLVFLAIVFCSLGVFSQTIPNGSFENWGSIRPVGWDGSNETVIGVTFNTIIKYTEAPQSGLYAVKIQTVTNTIPFAGPVTMPGILTLGDFVLNVASQNADIIGGISFPFRPVRLKGYYMSVPKTGDKGIVGMIFYRWNTLTNSRDTIGTGMAYFSDSVATWTEFQTEIDWTAEGIPDSLNIIATSSNLFGNVFVNGSALWLDNLSFEYEITGENENIVQGNLQVFVSQNLFSEAIQIRVESPDDDVYDMIIVDCLGKQVFSERIHLQKGATMLKLDLNSLSSGIHICNISNEKFSKTAKFIFQK